MIKEMFHKRMNLLLISSLIGCAINVISCKKSSAPETKLSDSNRKAILHGLYIVNGEARFFREKEMPTNILRVPRPKPNDIIANGEITWRDSRISLDTVSGEALPMQPIKTRQLKLKIDEDRAYVSSDAGKWSPLIIKIIDQEKRIDREYGQFRLMLVEISCVTLS